MDNFLDEVWVYLFTAIQYGASSLDRILSSLHLLGPAPVIFLLALAVVGMSKFLSRKCKTKRYKVLEKDFNYWLNLREETGQFADIDKGKRMARNIDQAKLNRVYYDYFFEGLMLSLVTTCLPIATMAAYVNEFYKAERLGILFGQPYIFEFAWSADGPIRIGGLFWYVLSLMGVYLAWGLLARFWPNVARAVSCSGVASAENLVQAERSCVFSEEK